MVWRRGRWWHRARPCGALRASPRRRTCVDSSVGWLAAAPADDSGGASPRQPGAAERLGAGMPDCCASPIQLHGTRGGLGLVSLSQSTKPPAQSRLQASGGANWARAERTGEFAVHHAVPIAATGELDLQPPEESALSARLLAHVIALMTQFETIVREAGCTPISIASLVQTTTSGWF